MPISARLKTVGANPSKARGIVLPVVLVMLVLMTVVVLFMSRRSAVDERLAFNVRGTVTLETAAQYALRWCELALWNAPPDIKTNVGFGASKDQTVRAMDAPGSSATAAWRVAANWNAEAMNLPTDAFSGFTPVTSAQCLIENARAELDIPTYADGSEGLTLDDTRRKYRLTTKVVGPIGIDGVQVAAHAQSEVRMNFN